MKQKKRPVLDITGFFFRIRTQVTAYAPRPSLEYACGKRNMLYPIRANSFVSIIMYLTCTIIVLLKKIYGMAYVFTLLMFRKPNKTTINKNKTTNCYRSTCFRFSFIFRYFKCPKSSPVVCLICYSYSSVVTVAEWLDGSFENQNRLWKAQQWFETRKSKTK